MPSEIDPRTRHWFHAKFGPLTDAVVAQLILVKELFNLSNDDVYIQWESFVVTQGNGDMDLSTTNIERFQRHLHSVLASSQTRRTPAVKKIRDLAGAKRKPDFDFSSPAGLSPHLKHSAPPSSEPWSSPLKLTAADVLLSPRAAVPADPDTIVESLNPAVEIAPLADSVRIFANFDPEKYRFRTMAMKLLESADVLDDLIDAASLQLLDLYKSTDTPLGNPCMSSQCDVVCCGRIVPDSPTYDVAPVLLNDKSLFLETSRFGGIGQRVPLDLSGAGAFSLFPGQIAAFKGRNPTGRAFLVHEVLLLPPLGAPVTSLPSLAEVLAPDRGTRVFVAAGPYCSLVSCDYSKLDALVTKLNDTIKPHVAVLFGPFVDLANSAVQLGNIDVPGLTPNKQPKTLEDVFRAVVTPILKKISPQIQVVLVPSLRDAASKHASYPQASMDRKKLGLPKNFKCFPNPSTFSVNEALFGVSNLDVFRDLKDVYRAGDNAQGVSTNRIERIVNHVFEQRRFYPIFPGSVRTTADRTKDRSALYDGMMADEMADIDVGGSCLEVPYLGLSELGDSLPDVMVIPSELKYFAKVIRGVVVINPGQFVRPHRDASRTDGSYVILNIRGADRDAPDNVEQVPGSDMYYHNVYKRTCVDIYRS